jgi:hypothetical protein
LSSIDFHLLQVSSNLSHSKKTCAEAVKLTAPPKLTLILNDLVAKNFFLEMKGGTALFAALCSFISCGKSATQRGRDLDFSCCWEYSIEQRLQLPPQLLAGIH